MAIEKKSLISTLKTTKKANVASTAEGFSKSEAISTKRAPLSTKRAPLSTKRAPLSTKRAPLSTKRAID